MQVLLALLWAICLPLLSFGLQNDHATESVSLAVAHNGLSSIRFGGSNYLARGDFQINYVEFLTKSGVTKRGNVHGQTSYDPKIGRAYTRLDWGSISVTYTTQTNRLLVNIETSNQTDWILSSLSYDALALRFAQATRQFDGNTPLLSTNSGAPTVILLGDAKTTVALCNEDVTTPLLIGFPWAIDKPANRAFPLRINTGREAMYPDSLPTVIRPIAPHTTDVIHLSLRFGDGRSTATTLASDILHRFAAAYPYSVNWPDRRPIGSLVLATAAQHWATNPRGWFLDAKLDAVTASGKLAFHDRLLDWADRSVDILKALDAQGMVTWDIEGEEFPHPTTYIGDSERALLLAPEMTGVLDQYFARFTRAGLRVGLTIRPQMLRLGPGRLPEQMEVNDAAAVLIRKISYAKKRWHASMFYIDSNGSPNHPMQYKVLQAVNKAHPDVLLIPEHRSLAYYALTAPYQNLREGTALTPTSIRDVYPRAFSVINVADGPVEARLIDLRESVRRGDILMVRGWFADPVNAKVYGIYLNSKHNDERR